MCIYILYFVGLPLGAGDEAEAASPSAPAGACPTSMYVRMYVCVYIYIYTYIYIYIYTHIDNMCVIYIDR